MAVQQWVWWMRGRVAVPSHSPGDDMTTTLPLNHHTLPWCVHPASLPPWDKGPPPPICAQVPGPAWASCPSFALKTRTHSPARPRPLPSPLFTPVPLPPPPLQGKIRQDGSGLATFCMTFSCLAFRPFKDEVVDAVVESVSKVWVCWRRGGGQV